MFLLDRSALEYFSTNKVINSIITFKLLLRAQPIVQYLISIYFNSEKKVNMTVLS